jgi:hypothetical protein
VGVDDLVEVDEFLMGVVPNGSSAILLLAGADTLLVSDTFSNDPPVRLVVVGTVAVVVKVSLGVADGLPDSDTLTVKRLLYEARNVDAETALVEVILGDVVAIGVIL